MNGKIITVITAFEKILRLPKCVYRKQKTYCGVFTRKLCFVMSYYEDDVTGEECVIEYLDSQDDGYAGLRWSGEITQVIDEAYQFFHNSGELIEDESKIKK